VLLLVYKVDGFSHIKRDEDGPVSRSPSEPQPFRPGHDLPIDEIREAVAKVRFGTVQLIIQDGRVIQIDITEKKRLA
jgi:hypothetical protein